MTAPTPALEIHFDPSNPAKRFWSFESPRDRDGNQQPDIFHEYRVAVFNPTAGTVRSFGVTVESLGLSGLRPFDAWFDKDRSARRDIHPGCFELVPVLRWPHPARQPGMVAEPSSLIGYGPLLVTASADDVAPATRQFGSARSASRCCSTRSPRRRRSARGRHSRCFENEADPPPHNPTPGSGFSARKDVRPKCDGGVTGLGRRQHRIQRR